MSIATGHNKDSANTCCELVPESGRKFYENQTKIKKKSQQENKNSLSPRNLLQKYTESIFYEIG